MLEYIDIIQISYPTIKTLAEIRKKVDKALTQTKASLFSPLGFGLARQTWIPKQVLLDRPQAQMKLFPFLQPKS